MIGEGVASEPVTTPLLGRLFRRWRPREGWVILALAWLGVISLPAAAVEGRLLAGIEVTLLLSTLGLLFGWWAGHRSWRGLFAAALGLLAGAIATLIWGVHVVSLVRLPLAAWEAGRRLAWLIACGLWPKCQNPAPPLVTLGDQFERLVEFGGRVVWWIHGALTGRGIPDNLVVVGFAALLAWGLAAWAGWWLARHGRTFVALFPTGFLLPQQVYNADAGHMWLLTFLAALTLLLVIAGFHRLEREWEAAGVDYSEELRLDAALIAAGLALIVLTLSPLLPALSPRALSEAFWRTFEEPYRRVEEQMAQSFPGIESRRSLVPPLGVAAGGLPRAHLLGGRPELSQEIALRIQVRGARPGEALYWRGQTFAGYTGRGWTDTFSDRNVKPLQLDLGPGEPWTTALLPLRRNVLASVQVEKATRAVLYAAGEPLAADRPYRATLRAADELISLSAPAGPDRYTVLGAVADAGPAALRGAGNDYSADIRDLYLQLPADLPAALADYAAAITAGAPTPYDKASAIEAALRQLPYTLDVPPPPKDRELVSWFLFDLRRGYCDYFASAMVVLARLSGVPARLAVGYAAGAYDPQSGRYVVTEMDAHSWPEIYFPGFGWIPFEPTPAREVPRRDSSAPVPFEPDEALRDVPDLTTGLAELRDLAAEEASTATRRLWERRVVGMLNLLLAFMVVANWRAMLAGRRGEGIAAAYERLMDWGRRLGRPVAPGDTPRTYAAGVIAAVERIAADLRRPRPQLAQAEAVVRAEVPRLTETFEAALYAGEEASATEQQQEPMRYAALWAALRRLWLARWRMAK